MAGPQRQDMLLELLASGGQEGFDERGELCVLEGRLSLASLASPPSKTARTIFLTLNRSMRYHPYCADFGPFNLGERTARIRFCIDSCARQCARLVVAHARRLPFPHRFLPSLSSSLDFWARRHDAPNLHSHRHNSENARVQDHQSRLLHLEGAE